MRVSRHASFGLFAATNRESEPCTCVAFCRIDEVAERDPLTEFVPDAEQPRTCRDVHESHAAARCDVDGG